MSLACPLARPVSVVTAHAAVVNAHAPLLPPAAILLRAKLQALYDVAMEPMEQLFD